MEFQIVRTTDPARPFFWRIVDGDGHMLTYSSDRYRTKADCLAAIESVRSAAASASIADLSDG